MDYIFLNLCCHNLYCLMSQFVTLKKQVFGQPLFKFVSTNKLIFKKLAL